MSIDYSCKLKPTVKNKQGEFKDSKLFDDLLSFTKNNRSLAHRLYYTITSTRFKNDFFNKIDLDEFDEPTLSSVLKNIDTKKIADDIEITNSIDRRIGAVDKENNRVYKENTIENFKELYNKAIEANESSDLKNKFVTIVDIDSNGMLFLETITADKQSDALLKNAKYNLLNIEALERLFTEKLNLPIGLLNDIYKEVSDVSIDRTEVAHRIYGAILSLAQKANGNMFGQGDRKSTGVIILRQLDNTPRMKRFINEVSNNKDLQKILLGESYDNYSKTLSENELINKALIEGLYGLISGETSPTIFGKYSNLIKETVKFIYSQYKDIDTSYIIDTMNTIDASVKDMQEHTSFNRSYNEILIHNAELAAKQSSRIKLKAMDIRNLLEKMIAIELKQYDLYSKRLEKSKSEGLTNTALEKWQKEHNDKLADIKNNLLKHEYTDGVLSFLRNLSADLETIANNKIPELLSPDITIDAKAFKIGNINNYIDKYDTIFKELKNYDSFSDDESINENIRKIINSIDNNAAKIKRDLKRESVNTFGDFLSRFLDENGISITSGKKAIKITRNDIPSLLETAESDISLINAWVESPAQARSVVIKLADQAMKSCKERKRQRVLNIKSSISAAYKKLEESGIKNTDFMFETHDDGSLSIRYKSRTNWTKFFDNKDAFAKYLEDKYGPEPKGDKYKEYKAEIKDWEKANLDEYRNPKASVYDYKNEEEMMSGWNDAQKNYYRVFMKIRDSLTDMLPYQIYKNDPMLAIQITKDTWERIKSSSIDTMSKQIIQAAKDQLITKVDDTNYGSKSHLENFAGEEVLSVPIFFTKKVKNESDLSRDTTSTLLAFADSTINYDEMSNVVDIFEIGRRVINDSYSKVKQNRNDVTEDVKILGKVIKNPVKRRPENTIVAYRELLESQLYHRYMKQENLYEDDTKTIKWTSAAKLINRITSLNSLALNGLAGIAAVGNDIINVNSEALAGEYFTAKQLANADKEYFKNIPEILGELKNPIKVNKLNLFIEKFDVLHEYDGNILDMGFDTSKLKKIMSENSLYFLMTAGSHWGEVRTAVAQAMNIKVESDDGAQEKSLWDILKVKYVDENNKELGATLVVEDGFKLTTADITRYTRRFMGLNQRLFGVYNEADKAALQRTAIGSMVFLFRKFLVPGLNRRFAKADYNLDLDRETEGYYRSLGNFLLSLLDDSDGLRFHILAKYDELSAVQKANVIRAANELGMFTILTIASVFIGMSDWTDKDSTWGKRFLAYMTKRMATEAGALSPLGVLGETWNIIKSPAAAVNTLESAGNIIKVFNPYNYEGIGGEDALVKQGRYKGHNKAYKYFMNSPLVPMNKTVYKFFHPEESLIAFR